MRQVINQGVELSKECHTFLFYQQIEQRLTDHLLILDPICQVVRTCEKITLISQMQLNYG